VHVVLAIIQRLQTLSRISMKPELCVGFRIARRGWLGASDDQLPAVFIRN